MEQRRSFLGKLLGASTLAAGGVANTVAGDTETDSESDGAGVAWRQSYSDATRIQSAAPTGDGGFVLAERPPDEETHPNAVTLTLVDRVGRVRRRTTVTPAESTNVGGETPSDIVQTGDGYALARGGWLALLDDDLTVREATLAPPEAEVNSDRTILCTLSSGYAVAQIRWRPSGVETHVYRFGADGSHRWTESHPHRYAASFLVPADRGVAVGGVDLDGSDPWVAVHDPDGTQRWRSVYDPDESVGNGEGGGSLGIEGTASAVADAEGVTVTKGTRLIRVGWDDTLRRVEAVPPFPERAGDRQAVWEIFARADGGHVLFGEYEARPTRFAVVSVDPNGQTAWRVEFNARGNPRLSAGVRRGPESFLVFGGQTWESEPSGLAVFVTGPEARQPTPTPSPTATPSPTPTQTPPPTSTRTPSPAATPTDTLTPTDEPTNRTEQTRTTAVSSSPTLTTTERTRQSDTSATTGGRERATETTLPGLGAWTTAAAVAGLGAWLTGRREEEE